MTFRQTAVAIASALLAVTAAGCAPYEPAVRTDPYASITLQRDDGTIADMADPDVVKFGDRWYMYGTTLRNGFEVWSSSDMSTWRYDGFAWRPVPGAWNSRGEFWAPDVSRDDDGTFLMYYTANSGQIGVARATSPAGPFTDILDGPLLSGGIDAYPFRASNGDRYLYFSGGGPGVNDGATSIRAVRLADDAVLAGEPQTVLFGEAKWEANVREGPWVREVNGRFYLSYSGHSTFLFCYAIGEGVADNPMGPFTRLSPNPFLHGNPLIGFFGPGHHSITTGPDGKPVIFFHTTMGLIPLGEGRARPPRAAPIAYTPDGAIELIDPPIGTTGPSPCG